MFDLRCEACNWSARVEDQEGPAAGDRMDYCCPRCQGPLDIVSLRPSQNVRQDHPGLWRYSPWLPVDYHPGLFLGEGQTPLIPSRSIGPALGLKRLFFKCEHLNPTGSFKDRQVSVGVVAAVKWGKKGCITSSSGNAGASLATYCARAGIPCVTLVPAGTPPAKLAQMEAHGAKTLLLGRASADADKYLLRLHFVQWLASRLGWWPAITARSANPFMIEGAKTIFFEICETFGWRSPRWVVLPVGGGGLAGATWLAAQQLFQAGMIAEVPHLLGVQPVGASTVSRTVKESLPEINPVQPTTRISGIGAPLPYDGMWAVNAIRQSGGDACEISDEEAEEVSRLLAREEGLYVETAGAASVAGLIRWLRQGARLGPEETVVCVLTGHGLKKDQSQAASLVEDARGSTTVLDIEELSEIMASGSLERLRGLFQ